MIVPSALLLALTVTAAAPRAAVVVHASGFPDADVQRIEEKVGGEVKSTGAELWALSKAVEVKAECLENRACAAEVLVAADASYLLWVELLRAGARVQLSSRLLDGDGRVIAEDDGAIKADALFGPAPLVPGPVLAPLQSAASASAATTSTTTTTTTTVESGTPAPAAEGRETHAGGQAGTGAEAPPAADESALSPLAIGGIAALGVGTLLALGGVAVIPGQLDITRDAGSLGTEKEAAAGVVVAAGAIAAVGAATAITGGVLLALGLQSEPAAP